MQYMLIFTEPTEVFAKREDPAEAPAYWGAWTAYMGSIAQAGIMVNGDGLHPPHTATTVRVRGGGGSTGRTSTEPYSAEGDFAAQSSAASRPATSMTT